MNQYVQFPFLRSLEDGWEDVLEELNNLLYNEAENNRSYFQPWHEVNLYEGQWDIYGLYSSGKKLTSNCSRCPKTTTLIESIPGVINAGFSSLAPETHVRPHASHDKRILRCNLGLITPNPLPDYDRRATGILTAKTCGLRVEDDFHYWEPGKAFVFDETKENESWNWGERTRFILAIDFKKLSSDWSTDQLNRRSGLGDILALGMSAKG